MLNANFWQLYYNANLFHQMMMQAVFMKDCVYVLSDRTSVLIL